MERPSAEIRKLLRPVGGRYSERVLKLTVAETYAPTSFWHVVTAIHCGAGDKEANGWQGRRPSLALELDLELLRYGDR